MGKYQKLEAERVVRSAIYTKLVWEGGEGTGEHGKQGIKLQGCLTITITTTTKLCNNKKYTRPKLKSIKSQNIRD